MKLVKYVILAVISVALLAGSSFAEIKNEKTIGLMLGDPIAVTIKVPVKEKTFLNIHSGIWTWSFWHDIDYDTPFLSVDYAFLFPVKKTFFYVGAGVAVFFADNPKDDNNYDAAAAVRLPVGIELYSKDKFSLGFEIAPIYQVLPAYSHKPYILELNGGLLINYSF